MPNHEQYDAFLSYSRRDRAWVSDLHENLQRANAKVFLDSQEITKTEEIEDKIRSALKKSKFLLLVLSPDAIASPWVRREISERSKQILIVKIATAPLPKGFSPDPSDEFDFEPSGESLADYHQQYRKQFERLCTRLGAKTSQPDGDRIRLPLRQLPRATYNRVLDMMEYILAWPAARKGFCVMLEMPPDLLDTEKSDLRMAANFLVHRIATEKGLPNDRASRMIMQTAKTACQFPEDRRRELEALLAEIQSLVTEKVDDEFVRKVRNAIGDDRYGITGILGGSFTIVLQARDNTLNRDVIVKVLRPRVVVRSHDPSNENATEPQPEEVREPFQYYTKIAASVDHPAFSRIHGARFTRDVNLCISEYFPGVTIGELSRLRQPIGVDLILTLLYTIGMALVHLEENGLVHTCLNPENMFVDKRGRVRISPFGIAREGDAITPMPRLYELAGCPSRKAELYCGPEETAGYRADRRAHQFGFGLLAAELLAGQGLDLELRQAEAKARIGRELQGWFEASAVCEGKTPLNLVPVLRKLLEKDPARRYASAKAALQALIKALRQDANAKLARGTQAIDKLEPMIAEIRRTAESEIQAAVHARQSLSRVLTDDFLKAFHNELQSNADVAKVFERQWRGRDQEQAEKQYFDKLRLALYTVIEYGAHPGYESLSLERVVASHGGYKVPPELYQVFTSTLIKTLEGWDPPFGVEEHVSEVRAAWEFLTQQVLRYVQGKAGDPARVEQTQDDVPQPGARRRPAAFARKAGGN